MADFNPVDLIEKYIDTIDQNKFDDFYDALEADIPSEKKSIIGQVTKTLENAGINPLEHLDYVPNYYCSYREDLKGDLYIPDNIMWIGTSAYSFCQNITYIHLPNNCKTLYPAAFAACTNLQSVDFPDGLKDIKQRAFYNCKLKGDIVLPDGLEKIGQYAFSGNKGLTSVTIPKDLKSLDSYPFGNPGEFFTLRLHKGTTLFQPYANLHIQYID